MSVALEDPAATAFPSDPVEEFAEVTRAYEAARGEVVRAAESYANAVEEASEIRSRYVALHNALLKAGVSTPRLPAGFLPGATSPTGLRERFRRAVQNRW